MPQARAGGPCHDEFPREIELLDASLKIRARPPIQLFTILSHRESNLDTIALMPPHSSILERLLQPSVGDMPADYAQRMMDIDFTDTDLARHRELAEKSQRGGMTEVERAELEELVLANDLLTILHAKAMLSLKHASAA